MNRTFKTFLKQNYDLENTGRFPRLWKEKEKSVKLLMAIFAERYTNDLFYGYILSVLLLGHGESCQESLNFPPDVTGELVLPDHTLRHKGICMSIKTERLPGLKSYGFGSGDPCLWQKDPDPDSSSLTFKTPTKNYYFLKFFCLLPYFLKINLHHFWKINSHKTV